MQDANGIRETQRAAWAGLSASWEKWDAVIMDQLAPVGTAIIKALGITRGQEHLDIASGTGEPALSIARIATEGRVTMTDLVPEMLEVAARRARAQGISNVRSVVASADELPFGDDSFDSVSVRFGYMFVPDMAHATAEFVRVLRPGGRLCAAVWIKPEENPWTTIAMQAIASEVTLPPADPDRPNMYRCATPGFMSELLKGAGLAEVREWDVPVELVTASSEEYWQMLSEHVSLAAAALKQVDAPTRDRIKARAIRDVRAYEKNGRVRLPGMARCVVGRKPV